MKRKAKFRLYPVTLSSSLPQRKSGSEEAILHW